MYNSYSILLNEREVLILCSAIQFKTKNETKQELVGVARAIISALCKVEEGSLLQGGAWTTGKTLDKGQERRRAHRRRGEEEEKKGAQRGGEGRWEKEEEMERKRKRKRKERTGKEERGEEGGEGRERNLAASCTFVKHLILYFSHNTYLLCNFFSSSIV